jgi:hypothetical protein
MAKDYPISPEAKEIVDSYWPAVTRSSDLSSGKRFQRIMYKLQVALILHHTSTMDERTKKRAMKTVFALESCATKDKIDGAYLCGLAN